MLARHMNGKPVTREHGAPLRLVIPQMYGYKGVKWVSEIRYDSAPVGGLLGAARLRHRRVGRALEWLLGAVSHRPAIHRAPSALAHWLLAGTFFVMLGSGLALYLPSLSNIVARPTAKAWHLWSAAVLGIGIVALIALGNRRALGRTARDLERLDRDDAEWIAGAPKPLRDRRAARHRRAASTPGRS